jgi:hypothetical protein
MTLALSTAFIIVGLLNHVPTPGPGMDPWLGLTVLGLGIMMGRASAYMRG